jgi:hypothetical protein
MSNNFEFQIFIMVNEEIKEVNYEEIFSRIAVNAQ